MRSMVYLALSLALPAIAIAPTIANAQDVKDTIHETRMRSPGMLALGITGTVVGTAAVAISSAFLALAHGQVECVQNIRGACVTTPANRDFIFGGGAGASLGGTALLGGAVLIVLGAMQVPVTPRFSFGPGGVVGRF